jgi:nucleoside-diphosphate-sugar epimerase
MTTAGAAALRGARCLVTGGAGFLGGRLCRRLAEAGAEVLATSRRPQTDGEGAARWWRLDPSDLESARRLVAEARPDRIFHLSGTVTAAPDLSLVPETFQSHLASAVNVLYAAAETGCGRVVLTGSLTEPDPALRDEGAISPMAAAKWASAGFARMFRRLYGLPHVFLRPSMIYGPAQNPTKLVPYVALALLRGERPRVTSGQWRVDWVFVDDVAEGMAAAAVAPGIEGLELDLATGRLTSVRDVVEAVRRLVGGPEPEFGALATRPDERMRAADTATARAALGWSAATTIEEGLERTVAWYRERAAEGRSTDLGRP